MRYRLSPSAPAAAPINIVLPASKSISNRALILHALAGGQELPANLSEADDTRVMVAGLGGRDETVDIMGAGTAMRFLTAYFSATPGTHTLTGSARMLQRPIGILADALRQLGADISYAGREGFPPLRITGRELEGGELTLPGNVSSQFVSALLMIAPATKRGLTLRLTGQIVSRPYIDLTLEMMQRYGVAARWTADDTLRVPRGSYRDTPFTVENDWSAASYWYEVAALCTQPHVTVDLPGLYPDSRQGDSRGGQLFAQLGVATHYTPQGIRLTKHDRRVERLDEEFSDIPDLVQTFAVTCCLLDIPFRFRGVQTLRIKETDRISALIAELRKLGYRLAAEGDHTLLWDGSRCTPLPRPVIATYDDHRMAMAFAPAALRTEGIGIADPQVVSKSYPRFWDDIQTVIHYEREQ